MRDFLDVFQINQKSNLNTKTNPREKCNVVQITLQI